MLRIMNYCELFNLTATFMIYCDINEIESLSK